MSAGFGETGPRGAPLSNVTGTLRQQPGDLWGHAAPTAARLQGPMGPYAGTVGHMLLEGDKRTDTGTGGS